jgi:hypothetical protein
VQTFGYAFVYLNKQGVFMKRIFTTLLLVLGFSSVAQAGDCFFSSQMRDWSLQDDGTMLVETRKADFVLDVGRCSQLRRTETIGFENHGSRWICAGDTVLLLEHFARWEVVGRCGIRSITKQ